MTVVVAPPTPKACKKFNVNVNGTPAGAASAVFHYDSQADQTLSVSGNHAGPATFTAVGSGAQPVTVTFFSGPGGTGANLGSQTGTVTVSSAPTGMIFTALTPSGTHTLASTTLSCMGMSGTLNGTIVYTLSTGPVFTANVVNGVVANPTDLGTPPAGTTVTVSFVPAAGSCAACTFAPITVVVGQPSSCMVVLDQETDCAAVGQPVEVFATVTCNGAPVSGATVTFTGGATPVVATTNANGVATGSLTFNTPGNATVTATVTASGTACSCTNVSSAPITITVGSQASCCVLLLPVSEPVVVGQPTSLSAMVLCNCAPVSGATVTFTGGATPVTATTDASGVATATVIFNTAGTATVTATVTASGTACSCTNVASTPVTITVQQHGGSTLHAFPACWEVNLPIPFPNIFKAKLRAQISPPTAGIKVDFYVGNDLVGSALTDATGTATLEAGLSPFQIITLTYKAVANVGTTRLEAIAPLLPCIPPV
ncbi:Ig-like domain-containing protein [Streptomyces tubercidicus]|uniref:Ig-like domain-containing protein n=1 Tax=Streptomyces tubercidicus TaxID=47759 RepID=UPI003698C6BA